MYAKGTWVKFTTSGRLFPHIECAEPKTGVIVDGWEDDGAILYSVEHYEGNKKIPTPSCYMCRHWMDIKEVLDKPPLRILPGRKAAIKAEAKMRAAAKRS